MKGEQALHRDVSQLLGYALTSESIWTTFPAGGGGFLRGKFLKATGLRAGWPDIQIIYRGRFYGIELKGLKGTLSHEQRVCHKAIENAGGAVVVCRSMQDVLAALETWGIPTRIHQGPSLANRILAAGMTP